MIARYKPKSPELFFRQKKLNPALVDPDMPKFLRRDLWTQKDWERNRELCDKIAREWSEKNRDERMTYRSQFNTRPDGQSKKRLGIVRMRHMKNKFIVTLTEKNPYRRGSNKHEQYELLKKSRTAQYFFKLGGKIGVIRRALKDGHIRLDATPVKT